jgi:hypothetical protein
VDPATPPEHRDPVAALPAARRAVELSKGSNGPCLDTLAQALFANGDAKAAVQAEEKALGVLKASGNPDENLRSSLEASLARFREAAAKGSATPPGGGEKRDGER